MSSPNIGYTNQLGTQAAPSSWNGSELATIIHGVGRGAGNVLASQSSGVRSRRDALEARRRTQARLLNNALRKRQDSYQFGNDYDNELNHQSGDIMQQVARGFVDSFKGSTPRR